MLQLIRGKVGSWFIKILFGFLILSFAVWGIGDLFRGGGIRATVATVGDERIPVQRLENAFQRELGRLQRALGPEIDVQMALSLGLLDQALDGLINESLFHQAARQLGIEASDQIIAADIRSEPLFRDSAGRFSADRFAGTLRAIGLSEPEYVALRRREMARERLVNAIAAGAATPNVLAGALHRYREETRHIAAIVIGDAAVGAIAPPSNEQIESYYRDHEREFMAPEYRVLSVVSLTPADLAEEISIAEEDVRAEYEYRLDRYETSERRAFEQVVVPDEETAARIAEAVATGLSLQEAVDSIDGLQASVIPLDLADRNSMRALVQDVADVGFALPPDGVSEPVRSPFGWHVLRVTEIVPGEVRTFDSARPEIEAEMKLERALDTLFEEANAFDDILAGGGSLEDAASQLGLPLTVTPLVARDGSLTDGGVLEGLPALPQVLQTGFGLDEGDESVLEETAEDGYFIVRADRVIAPAVRPLDEVREAVVAAWTEDRKAATAETLATAAAERLDVGDPIAGVAAEIGATILEQAELRRDGGNRGSLPQPVVDAVFALNVGDVTMSPTGDGYVVARLEAVNPAPPADAAALEDIAVSQSQAIAGDLLQGFFQALYEEYDVEVDRATMSRLFRPQ